MYHFHTRTKTGRVKELNAAAPEPFIEMHEADAKRLGIVEGDQVKVTGRRGFVLAPARITGILPGHLFMPFHYGYWDDANHDPDHAPSAANEITATTWDPVSKQPQYKFSAVNIDKVGAKPMLQRVTDLAAEVADQAQEMVSTLLARAHSEKSRYPYYLGLLELANEEFRTACEHVAETHSENSEIVRGAQFLRQLALDTLARLQPFLSHHGKAEEQEPIKLRKALFPTARHGDFGLLRDLHGLCVLASEIGTTVEILRHAAEELRDRPFIAFCEQAAQTAKRQRIWCMTQVQDNAAQSLVVPH